MSAREVQHMAAGASGRSHRLARLAATMEGGCLPEFTKPHWALEAASSGHFEDSVCFRGEAASCIVFASLPSCYASFLPTANLTCSQLDNVNANALLLDIWVLVQDCSSETSS